MSKILNKLFFNKYRVNKLIISTLFSSVYEGIYEKLNEPVIMKFEDKTKNKLLENEAFLLYYLKGFGIPKILSYGKCGLYNILVEEMLGLTIFQIWNSKEFKKEHMLKNISMIALQILDRFEYIHSKNIIHRDIKPNNFIVGRKDPKNIYLIDFGFAQKYRNSHTGKHIKYKFIKIAIGSLRYMSINGIKGYQQSRRDDLESLGYMLIYLTTKHLPWLYIEDQNIEKYNKIKEITKIKISTLPEILCKGLPVEFTEYIKYCRNLAFEQDPDYNYLKSLFINILIKIQQKNDLNFFWINNHLQSNNEIKNNNKKNISKKHILSLKKKLSSEKLETDKVDTLNNLKIKINNKKLNKNYINIKNYENINNDNIKKYFSNSVKNVDVRFINNKSLINSQIYTNKTNNINIENKNKLIFFNNTFSEYNININDQFGLNHYYNSNYNSNNIFTENNNNYNDDLLPRNYYKKLFPNNSNNKRFYYNNIINKRLSGEIYYNNIKLNKENNLNITHNIDDNFIKNKININNNSKNYSLNNINQNNKTLSNKNIKDFRKNSKRKSLSNFDNKLSKIKKLITEKLYPQNTLLYVPLSQRNKNNYTYK